MTKPVFDIEEIKEHFNFEGEYTGFYPIHNGHINNTYVLEFDEKDQSKSYLLQQINTYVFTSPDKLMENVVGVTEYLHKIIVENGGDPERETLNVIKTKDGAPYFVSKDNRYWRCYNFITDAYTCQSIENPVVFYNSAVAFGNFQRLLADYPADSLHETIPNFHNTVSRYNDLMEAVKNNAVGRLDSVKEEVKFAQDREADTHVVVDLIAEGKLPIRVTHNDTKLNNVMFDNQTDKGICVIDLDTVMPGSSLYDFGDSIRFGANHAAEDEKDLSLVYLDLNLFEQYCKGYLESAGKSLTKTEIEYLPFSAKLMTFECGMRFLGDYLNGDTYFKIGYPEHNLDRCHTQFALVADIEKKFDEMKAIVSRICSELGIEK